MTMITINSNEIIWHSSFYDFNDNDSYFEAVVIMIEGGYNLIP